MSFLLPFRGRMGPVSENMDIPDGGDFRTEELERAIKLSLNPTEQTSKEQQEFVLACKQSLQENAPKNSTEGTSGLGGNKEDLPSKIDDILDAAQCFGCININPIQKDSNIKCSKHLSVENKHEDFINA